MDYYEKLFVNQTCRVCSNVESLDMSQADYEYVGESLFMTVECQCCEAENCFIFSKPDDVLTTFQGVDVYDEEDIDKLKKKG